MDVYLEKLARNAEKRSELRGTIERVKFEYDEQMRPLREGLKKLDESDDTEIAEKQQIKFEFPKDTPA